MKEFIFNFNSIADSWFQFVWSSSWQSALLAAALIAIVALAKKIPAPFRYAILLVALVKFAVPPFMSAPSGVFSKVQIEAPVSNSNPPIKLNQSFFPVASKGPQAISDVEFGVLGAPTPPSIPKDSIFDSTTDLAAHDHGDSTKQATTLGQIQSPTVSITSSAVITSRPKASLTSWFMLLHISGSLLFCCLLSRSLFRLRKIKRQAVEPSSSKLKVDFQSLCDRLGLRRHPRLLVSTEITSPISFGCYQPVVMLPRTLLKNSDNTSIAIAHELAHLPELGKVSRQQIASLAGLAPHPRESGTWKGKRKIYGGRSAVRKALFLAARVASRWCPVIKRFYQRLKENGKAYKLAIIACARKMLAKLNSQIRQLENLGKCQTIKT